MLWRGRLNGTAETVSSPLLIIMIADSVMNNRLKIFPTSRQASGQLSFKKQVSKTVFREQ